MSLSQSFSQKIGNVRPLNPCPSLDVDFANGGYVNTGGFANQESVGSANFKIGAFNGPDPIFTRATAATFRGSNGLIQYAPENLIQYSEQFDNPYWSKAGATIPATTGNAPDGSATADKLAETAITYSHQVEVVPTYTFGVSYVWSVYAKAAERSWVILNAHTGGDVLTWFDLTNGVVGTKGFGVTATITDAGNGWWRLSVTRTSTGTSGFFSIGVASTNGVRTYAGTAGSGILIWGAQLERSSTARPYISTTALPVYGPRFEYDLSGNPLGLLMEEQSQNLVYPSATLTTQTRTVTAAPHTLSFYGTGSVSLSGATIGTVIGSGANTRTVYTFTPTAGSLTLTVSGSVTSAQLEQKPFATSYIPTVGGPMTRNADVVNSTIGSWFNQPEGTIVVSGDRSHSPSLNTSLYDSFYEFGDGGGGYHSAHFSDGTAEEFFGDNGAYATSAVGITTIGTLTSIASSYSSNDIYTTRDGITPNSAASATFLATPATLSIGYSQALTQAWNGHIKTFRYYPKALPDKLQRLSS